MRMCFTAGDRVRVVPQDEDDPVAIFMRGALFYVIRTRKSPTGSQFVSVESENKVRLVFREQDLQHES